MVYSVKDYARTFSFGGKFYSPKTIIRMGHRNQLPTKHRMFRLGWTYAIEVKTDYKEIFK